VNTRTLALIALLLLTRSAEALAQVASAADADSQLRMVVVVSRHGVRSPTVRANLHRTARGPGRSGLSLPETSRHTVPRQ